MDKNTIDHFGGATVIVNGQTVSINGAVNGAYLEIPRLTIDKSFESFLVGAGGAGEFAFDSNANLQTNGAILTGNGFGNHESYDPFNLTIIDLSQPPAVPETANATLLLGGIGLLSLIARRRRY